MRCTATQSVFKVSGAKLWENSIGLMLVQIPLEKIASTPLESARRFL